MNTKILKKINSINKVELFEIKVDLALLDDLKSILTKARQDSSEMVNNYVEARSLAKKGIESAKLHLKNLENVSKLINDIKSQGDSLGIDITKIREWKDGYDFLNGNPKNATEIMIKKMESL